MRQICVYAGSKTGIRQSYSDATRALGASLVAHDISAVYGGGSGGLMGVLADTMLAEGGEVIGVMPRGLFRREHAHPKVTHMHQVGSMHERKMLMADLADAFIALPGGFGTLDELFEIITWAQIGIHTKPIGLLNVDHFYTPLLALIEHLIYEGFVPAENRRLLCSATDPDDLLAQLSAIAPHALRQLDEPPPAP